MTSGEYLRTFGKCAVCAHQRVLLRPNGNPARHVIRFLRIEDGKASIRESKGNWCSGSNEKALPLDKPQNSVIRDPETK